MIGYWGALFSAIRQLAVPNVKLLPVECSRKSSLTKNVNTYASARLHTCMEAKFDV